MKKRGYYIEIESSTPFFPSAIEAVDKQVQLWFDTMFKVVLERELEAGSSKLLVIDDPDMYILTKPEALWREDGSK